MITPRKVPESSEVGAHYDEIDLFYRDLWGEHLHHGFWLRGSEGQQEAVHQLLEFVIAEAHLQSRSRVCDVGCGYGGTARFLADRLGCRVTGYTVSKLQHAFAVAAPHAGPICHYVLADWLSTQADDGPFDTVLAIESTEHILDKEGFFHKAYRVLKPGGRLVVCAWVASEKARSWEIERLLEPICLEGQLTSLGTETEYLSWIREAGFNRVRSTDISREVSRTWRIIAFRVVRELFRKRAWQYLSNPESKNRSFLKCVFRIALAYRTGAFRYLVFSAQRSIQSGDGAW